MSRKPQPEPSHEPQEPSSDATATPQQTIERLQRQLHEANDQRVRALAEFENSRKRLNREKEEFVRYAAETVVRQLLPIIDSLDQALVAVDKQADTHAVVKGVHLIYRQLLGLLEKEGVERIPTIGEPFDPHQHEAVAQVEASDGTPEDTVVEEVQVGYTMHGRVIRPAIVKVAKKPATSNQPSVISEDQRTGGSDDD
jgi:molecular chaperone GrpE